MDEKQIEQLMHHLGKALDIANELEPHDKHEILPGVVKHLHRAFFWVTRLATMHGVLNDGDDQQTGT